MEVEVEVAVEVDVEVEVEVEDGGRLRVEGGDVDFGGVMRRHFLAGASSSDDGILGLIF